ncbi:hypothetical protein TWF696_002261 [Orbilia brochopaga]|uniref:Uncharacterized protein n=1 Tax=Orbilia brochopaga TaxID=3140254 RepID=A0AAV9U3V8_9PEZI
MEANYGQHPHGKMAEDSYAYGAYTQSQTAPPKKKSASSPWGLVQMLGTFLAACGLGVGHHYYYSYLDGRVAEHQSWYLAGGNAISYVARLLFSASIGLCIRQWFWKAMRAQPWTLGTIDKLHGVKDSPLSLVTSPGFAGTFLARAPIGLLITLFVWTLPVIPIIAPTSLSTHVVFETFSERPIQISNLDLTPTDSFTTDTTNTSKTFKSQFDLLQLFGAARGGYASPSSRALGLVYNTFNGGQILTLPSPCNGNCTFNQTFFGPTYKCEEVTPLNDEPGNPFCYNRTTADCASGYAAENYPYVATWYESGLSTCNGTEVDRYACDNGIAGNVSTQAIGAASTIADGRIWFFYRWLAPEYRDPNRTKYDESIWENHRVVCRSYNASFNLQRTYLASGLDQTVGGTLEYINPVNFSRNHMIDPTPGELAAYAINDILFSLLSGSIAQYAGPSTPALIDRTQLAGSKLVEAVPFPPELPGGLGGPFGIQKPVRDLAQAIEELHFNVTVGMLSIQDLSWLKNETVSSTQYVSQNQWTYNWLTLAAVYGGFALANIVALAVGLYAIVQNHGGFIKNDGFLRIMMTTRNPELDRLTEPVSDGRGDDDEQELLEDREVRFGYLLQDPPSGAEYSSTRRVGFGFPDSVVGLGK